MVSFSSFWFGKLRMQVVVLTTTVLCLCQICPRFLIPSGFQSWTGCLQRKVEQADSWVLHYRGWGLRSPSCWVNHWGPRGTRRYSWSHWGDFWSLYLDTTQDRSALLRKNTTTSDSRKNPDDHLDASRWKICFKNLVLYIHTKITRAVSPKHPVLWLGPCCQSNQDAVCFYWSPSLSLQFTGKGEGIRRGGGEGGMSVGHGRRS